ncbi:MAG: hypothetical protein R6W31_04965 [Bacteroidales bacterium]
MGEFYGGNSFYCWHNTDPGVVNLGEMPTDCWEKPYDFEHGHLYLRFEILVQPTDQPFFIQLGFWQNIPGESGHSEAISGRFRLENGAGTRMESDLGSPASWWQLKPDKPVNFSRPGDLYRIGLVLWNAEPLCLPMAQGWTNSNTCENPEQAALDSFPLRAKVSVVAVADGYSFSGWENYPNQTE